MKKTVFGHLLSVALVGSLMLSGCQKEKTGFLRLNAERLTSNEKTYVDGTTVQWLLGDQVWVNGIVYELVNDNTISGDPIGDDLLAIYPSSIIGDGAPSNNQVEVTIPSIYTYETDVIGGYTKQILAMPMVGKAAGSATSMTMKHLCSAMQITINNVLGEELVLDSIILRGSGLSGTVTVSNLDADNPTVGTGSNPSVRMAFPGTTIANNGSLTVQIPVLPVSSPCTTWVSVRGHLANSGTAYRYIRPTSIPLLRAHVHPASVTMSTTNNDYIAQVPSISEGALPAVFTVGAGTRVYFSKGNLQAAGTTSSRDNGSGWTWSFATHQYDYIGNNTANTSISGNGTISSAGTVDLFGWSTKTSYYGINNSTSYGSYGSSFIDWSKVFGDSSPWRTLSKNEWVYLINNRGSRSYLKATINVGNTTYQGLILFPDDYVGGIGNYSYNNGSSDFTSTSVTEEDWVAMESIGAVFLPAAGSRTGTSVNTGDGFYWSSDPDGTNNAYYVKCNGLSLSEASINRSRGLSVRLVRNI